jgi:hypothetical protein
MLEALEACHSILDLFSIGLGPATRDCCAIEGHRARTSVRRPAPVRVPKGRGRHASNARRLGSMHWADVDDVWWRFVAADDAARTERLLEYLRRFPRGRHNREAAERLERAADALPHEEGNALRAGLRALRTPPLGPVERGSWAGPRQAKKPVSRATSCTARSTAS